MACDFSDLTHTGIKGLQPYQPGKPASEVERELGLSDVVKLASNENPFGLSVSVKTAVKAALESAHLYPDASGFELKQTLSSAFALDPQRITLGNGSNELLDLVARVFVTPHDEIIYSQYGFLAYPIIAHSLDATLVEVPALNWGHDLEAMAARVSEKTKLIFIANPNNPTGTYVNTSSLTAFLDKVPANVIVVLDEAYTEFSCVGDFPNGLEWVDRYPNLVVTRTFSKAYCLAGMRLGYAYASAQITDLLNRVRQPFNTNLFAQVAAVAALEDQESLKKVVANNQRELKKVVDGLTRLGLESMPSIGNFVTFRCPNDDAKGLYESLLKRGVIVRPLGNYDLHAFLRVSIGLPDENETFLKVLQEELS